MEAEICRHIMRQAEFEAVLQMPSFISKLHVPACLSYGLTVLGAFSNELLLP